MVFYRRFTLSVIGIILLLLFGTAGYHLFEGWGFLDAFYMTVITISTVGFKEVGELSQGGRIFTILLIFTSVGTVAYAFSSIIIFVVEGSLKNLLKERRMSKVIEKLQDHYIVCGVGQTGKRAISELQKAQVPFVVIEKDKRKYEELLEHQVPVVLGDATNDEILQKVRIEKARAVICALNNDADNVYTVLSCRQLNSGVYIVSRAIESHSETKLLKAGANAAVSPNEIGGLRMATLALKPGIVSFLDIVYSHEQEITINIREVTISPSSSLVGLSQQKADIRNRTGLTILGVLSGYKKTLNPPLEMVFQAGDILLAFGTDSQVEELKKLCL